jgi:hypothetical protein
MLLYLQNWNKTHAIKKILATTFNSVQDSEFTEGHHRRPFKNGIVDIAPKGAYEKFLKGNPEVESVIAIIQHTCSIDGIKEILIHLIPVGKDIEPLKEQLLNKMKNLTYIT